MERFETSFAVILRSQAAAVRRMRDLAAFAEATPFNLPEIAEASRMLEVLTRGVVHRCGAAACG